MNDVELRTISLLQWSPFFFPCVLVLMSPNIDLSWVFLIFNLWCTGKQACWWGEPWFLAFADVSGGSSPTLPFQATMLQSLNKELERDVHNQLCEAETQPTPAPLPMWCPGCSSLLCMMGCTIVVRKWFIILIIISLYRIETKIREKEYN